MSATLDKDLNTNDNLFDDTGEWEDSLTTVLIDGDGYPINAEVELNFDRGFNFD